MLNHLLGGKSAAQPTSPAQPAQSAQPNLVAQPWQSTQTAGGVTPLPVAPGGMPINTQQHQSGFHGLIPMVTNYYQNHQAGVRDAAAQPHLQSLQDPNITPEQRQYHISALQQTYSAQPQVLQQLGIAPQGTAGQGGYFVPQVQGTAAGGK